MSQIFEKIPGIEAATIGSPDSELMFGYPRVLGVIALCATNEIAVLGLELFEVRPDGYVTLNYSGYDQGVAMHKRPPNPEDWAAYVLENNGRAEEFVREHPAVDAQVYILTTVSWNEFYELPGSKRRELS